MKYISVAIPCYNSEAYMNTAIESVLVAGEDVEIIIVNDGSKDKTSQIAHAYATKYPTIVKAVDQENGGHGEAVNTGLRHATGKFFKVLDSDDWLKKEALLEIIEKFKELEQDNIEIDVMISNYVYEKVGAKKRRVINYTNALPTDEVFTWDKSGYFWLGQYILMHSVMYRTDMLKLSQLKLPKHTFYVDNIYVYYPLPHVRKMYYMSVNLYRYFIGRDGQSVNEKNMIARIDQQLFVTRSMIDMYNLGKIRSKKLKAYMTNYLAIMMAISSIIAIRSKDEENLKKKKELWQYLKSKNLKLYLKIRYGILGQSMNLPGKSGRKISSLMYVMTQQIIGFN